MSEDTVKTFLWGGPKMTFEWWDTSGPSLGDPRRWQKSWVLFIQDGYDPSDFDS